MGGPMAVAGNNSYLCHNVYWDGAEWKILSNSSGQGGFGAIIAMENHWGGSGSGTGGAISFRVSSGPVSPNVATNLVTPFWLNDTGVGATKLTVWDLIYVTSFTHSDIRQKKNIQSISRPLDKVLRLRGVEFEWNQENPQSKNFPEGKQIGVIAQEVEREFPELVTKDSQGYKMVAYDKLAPILIEAVKEQEMQVKSQQNEIGALKKDHQAQIDSLKQKIDALESKLTTKK